MVCGKQINDYPTWREAAGGNEEKILSLNEGYAAESVRGKAGAEVEFGSQLRLAEAESGLITDWELVCGDPEHHTVLLKRSLERNGRRR